MFNFSQIFYAISALTRIFHIPDDLQGIVMSPPTLILMRLSYKAAWLVGFDNRILMKILIDRCMTEV